MLSIKDYIDLKDIELYLERKRDDEVRQNNNFSNLPIQELEDLLKKIRRILSKLEEE